MPGRLGPVRERSCPRPVGSRPSDERRAPRHARTGHVDRCRRRSALRLQRGLRGRQAGVETAVERDRHRRSRRGHLKRGPQAPLTEHRGMQSPHQRPQFGERRQQLLDIQGWLEARLKCRLARPGCVLVIPGRRARNTSRADRCGRGVDAQRRLGRCQRPRIHGAGRARSQGDSTRLPR